MRNIPLDGTSWSQFVTFFQTPPPAPKKAIFIAEQTPEHGEVVAAGVCVIDTEGPYILFESFAVNPALPVTVRHKAATAVMVAIKGVCTVNAKMGIVLVGPASVASGLEKRGFMAYPNIKAMSFLPRAFRVAPPATERRDTEPAPPPPEPQSEPDDEPIEEPSEELDPFLETEEQPKKVVKRKTMRKKR